MEAEESLAPRLSPPGREEPMELSPEALHEGRVAPAARAGLALNRLLVLQSLQPLAEHGQSLLLALVVVEEETRRPVAQLGQPHEGHCGVPGEAHVKGLDALGEPVPQHPGRGVPAGEPPGDEVVACALHGLGARHPQHLRLELLEPAFRGLPVPHAGAELLHRAEAVAGEGLLLLVPEFVVPEAGAPVEHPHLLPVGPLHALL
mmetsp:Transcript_18215/g.51415  ORF Transcript_18215/g.51415 Transcript_18215/m.51415 type:complete len:204 (-) Transcript_18215:76-687(-)